MKLSEFLELEIEKQTKFEEYLKELYANAVKPCTHADKNMRDFDD